MNCPVVRSLFHSSLPSPGDEGPLLARSFQRLLLRNSPARYHAVSARSWRPVFFLWSLWDSLPQNPGPNATPSGLPCEVVPVPQERWSPLPLAPLLPSSRLGGAARALPHPGPPPGPLAGWGLAVPLSPCVFSFNRGGESSPDGSKLELPRWPAHWWIPQIPGRLSPLKNQACLPGLCWAPSSSL